MNESEIEWVIDPSLVEKPETESKLAHLLINEVVFLNNFWYEKSWPEDAKKYINILVHCSDTFAYACSDAEPLSFSEINDLYQMWRKDPMWGSTVWCTKKRKERPLLPIEKVLRERGYDVDSWELRNNTTNAETQACFAHVAAESRASIKDKP